MLEERSREGDLLRFEGSGGANDPFFPELFPNTFHEPSRAFVTFLLPCTPTAPHRTSVSRNGTISSPLVDDDGELGQGKGGEGRKKSGEKMGERIERLLPLGRCGSVVVVVAVTGGDAFSTTESLIDRFYFLIAKVSRAETTFLPAPRFLFSLSSSSSSSRRKEIPLDEKAPTLPSPPSPSSSRFD